MDHARNKIILCLLLVLSACSSKKPEERLIEHLEEKYANLYFNNEVHKRKVIKGLREYFAVHKLNDENFKEINQRLSQLNDGHVVIFDERKKQNIRFTSGLTFIAGSDLIDSCDDCSPILPSSKYKILEVNKKSFKDFIMKNKDNIAASTDWGRYFRITRLLTNRKDNQETILKLKDISGKVFSTKLSWKEEDVTKPLVCVNGKRLAPDVFKVSVINLWCDDSRGNGWEREQIYGNFKNQFDSVMNNAQAKDRIILELRENGGGGDEEVEYVLNAFYEQSVLMYHFKYLKKTRPGKLKWIVKFWPFEMFLWSPDEYEHTNIQNRPKKTFYKNKMATIISSGCFSSCETIASVLKNNKRSIVIGSKTHGGSGDPVIFPIEDTPYSINIPTCVNWQEPGKTYEGVGVEPNLTIEQNPKIKEDNILKKAIDLTQ